MSLQRRVAALEKKRKANEQPLRQLGMFAGQPIWRTEERDGVVYCLPLFTTEEFSERCRAQQKKLLEDLAAYEATLNEHEEGTVEHGKDTSPASVGFNDQLAPGAKPLKFRYETDASGTEWQIEVSSGQKWKV